MPLLCMMSIFEIAKFAVYDNKKQLKLLRSIANCLQFCAEYIDDVANH